MIVKATITVMVGGVFAILVIWHTPGINGPGFWPWDWRVLPPWPLHGLMAAAVLPLLAGHVLYRPASKWRACAAIGLAMVSCYGLKLASVSVHTTPPSLRLVPIIVENRFATSYYTDAAALNSQMSVREWLTNFPQLMPALSLHSKTKAPGPILFYTAFIKLMGVSERTALVSGLVVGAIGTFSIPAAYFLLRLLTRDDEAAMCGATFLALCPGFVLFSPMFDPAYILLSAALIGLWVIALERRSRFAALALGAALALTCTISFNVLVIGLFMSALPRVVLDGPPRQRLVRVVGLGALALATAGALLLILWLTSGYNAPGTFAAAWRNQHQLLETYRHTRPYPQTIPFDLTDLALGSGWTSFVLVGWFFANRRARDGRQLRLAVLCLGQLVIVAATGLLQLETARVWNFMLPLLMLPVGLELRTWPTPARLAVYATLCLVLAAIAQNVKLIY